MNKAPIHWYSKQQPTVESSTFGAEFCAMKTAVEMIEGIRYKLRMFGIPIEGSANVFCDMKQYIRLLQSQIRHFVRSIILLPIIVAVKQLLPKLFVLRKKALTRIYQTYLQKF